jgi:hypothetical protein
MKPSITTNSEELAIRVDESNLNHHLWNNNGTWWLHYTVYPTPVTSDRRRRSLRTQNIKQARLIRDKIFHALDAGKLPLAA